MFAYFDELYEVFWWFSRLTDMLRLLFAKSTVWSEKIVNLNTYI